MIGRLNESKDDYQDGYSDALEYIRKMLAGGQDPANQSGSGSGDQDLPGIDDPSDNDGDNTGSGNGSTDQDKEDSDEKSGGGESSDEKDQAGDSGDNSDNQSSGDSGEQSGGAGGAKQGKGNKGDSEKGGAGDSDAEGEQGNEDKSTDGKSSGDGSEDGQADNGSSDFEMPTADSDIKDLDVDSEEVDELSEEQLDELRDRLANIRKLLSDNNFAQEVIQNSERVVRKEIADRKKAQSDAIMQSPIQRFKESLYGFISTQVKRIRDKSYSRFNKTYANSGLIKKGITHRDSEEVPEINVYFDHSGSWDESKIAVGQNAIGVLNNYVRRGEVKLNVYYFSNNVHRSAQAARNEGGTNGQPILDHIRRTQPTNVIIMTDADISDCRSTVVVPGAVWFLFKGGVSDNLQQHLAGKQLTKAFELDRSF